MPCSYKTETGKGPSKWYVVVREFYGGNVWLEAASKNVIFFGESAQRSVSV